MSELDINNLIRITKIITSATGKSTIEHNHISSALRIINLTEDKYSTPAAEVWEAYQRKQIPNIHFNKAKALLNAGEYRVKNDAVAYLSGIIMVHEGHIIAP
jgi:hypothetical protein